MADAERHAQRHHAAGPEGPRRHQPPHHRQRRRPTMPLSSAWSGQPEDQRARHHPARALRAAAARAPAERRRLVEAARARHGWATIDRIKVSDGEVAFSRVRDRVEGRISAINLRGAVAPHPGVDLGGIAASPPGNDRPGRLPRRRCCWSSSRRPSRTCRSPPSGPPFAWRRSSPRRRVCPRGEILRGGAGGRGLLVVGDGFVQPDELVREPRQVPLLEVEPRMLEHGVVDEDLAGRPGAWPRGRRPGTSACRGTR